MDHPFTSPAGVQLQPLLNVRRGTEAIEFYQRAFAAKVVFQMSDPGGSVVARLSIAGAEFWLADESPSHLNHSPESLGGSSVRLVIITRDPDRLFDDALTAGAKIVWPLADQPYGWRIGRLADPFGHHWEIGCPRHPENP